MDLLLTAFGITDKDGRRLIKECISKNYDRNIISNMRIAIISQNHPVIKKILMDAALEIGFRKILTISHAEDCGNIDGFYPDAWYLPESENVFCLMKFIRDNNLKEIIGSSETRLTIAASAGALCTGSSIEIGLDFDKNVGLVDFSGLNIIPRADEKERIGVIPHYDLEQFKKWKLNSDPELLSRYDDILFIPNSEYLFLREADFEYGFMEEFHVRTNKE